MIAASTARRSDGGIASKRRPQTLRPALHQLAVGEVAPGETCPVDPVLREFDPYFANHYAGLVFHLKRDRPPVGPEFDAGASSAQGREGAQRPSGVRWRIEDWHSNLKSGRKVEARAHQPRTRLERTIAINAVIAWRVAARAARANPPGPATGNRLPGRRPCYSDGCRPDAELAALRPGHRLSPGRVPRRIREPSKRSTARHRNDGVRPVCLVVRGVDHWPEPGPRRRTEASHAMLSRTRNRSDRVG